MFLKDIQILSTAPCVVVPDRIRFRARFSDDISGILPYLNAVIKNGIYNHEGKILSFTKDQRLITLYPREVTVAKALNDEDARGITVWLKELINETYAGRENIRPVYEKRSRPAPLALYGWLPKKLDCRRCGEQTCLAFAAQLITGGKQLKDCPVIWEDGKEDLLESLRELLTVLG
jgi:ArsR family metal-binding transcriptional regulator